MAVSIPASRRDARLFRRRHALAVIAALVLTPGIAAAQDAPPAHPPAHPRARSDVRGAPARGHSVRLAPDLLRARPAWSWRTADAWRPDRTPTARPLRAMWTSPRLTSSPRQRSYAVEGAVIGGVAVGLLGAITGVGLCHFDSPCPHQAPFAIGGFVLGGMVGGAVGAGIGSQFARN